MNIFIVSTINGLKNEGMRNVITHLSKAFEKKHTVLYSSLKDIKAIVRNSSKSEVVIVCSRATVKVYLLCKLIEMFCKKIFFIILQKPERGFIKLNNCLTTKCNYLTIYQNDSEALKLQKGCYVYPMKVGINVSKFRALTLERRNRLKIKHSFDLRKPVVLHVGHCSSGRGLEDFCKLDGDKYQRIIIASGLFEDVEIIQKLNRSGVKILVGFLPNIEELYQLADVYLFPTKITEFVISVPLSVMEALACGTPVIAYKLLKTIKLIKVVPHDAIKTIDDFDELNMAVKNSLLLKTEVSLLKDYVSWDESADEILKILEGCV